MAIHYEWYHFVISAGFILSLYPLYLIISHLCKKNENNDDMQAMHQAEQPKISMDQIKGWGHTVPDTVGNLANLQDNDESYEEFLELSDPQKKAVVQAIVRGTVADGDVKGNLSDDGYIRRPSTQKNLSIDAHAMDQDGQRDSSAANEFLELSPRQTKALVEAIKSEMEFDRFVQNDQNENRFVQNEDKDDANNQSFDNLKLNSSTATPRENDSNRYPQNRLERETMRSRPSDFRRKIYGAWQSMNDKEKVNASDSISGLQGVDVDHVRETMRARPSEFRRKIHDAWESINGKEKEVGRESLGEQKITDVHSVRETMRARPSEFRRKIHDAWEELHDKESMLARESMRSRPSEFRGMIHDAWERMNDKEKNVVRESMGDQEKGLDVQGVRETMRARPSEFRRKIHDAWESMNAKEKMVARKSLNAKEKMVARESLGGQQITDVQNIRETMRARPSEFRRKSPDAWESMPANMKMVVHDPVPLETDEVNEQINRLKKQLRESASQRKKQETDRGMSRANLVPATGQLRQDDNGNRQSSRNFRNTRKFSQFSETAPRNDIRNDSNGVFLQDPQHRQSHRRSAVPDQKIERLTEQLRDVMANVEHLNGKLAKSAHSQQFHENKMMEMENELESVKRNAVLERESATHSDFMQTQREMIKQRRPMDAEVMNEQMDGPTLSRGHAGNDPRNDLTEQLTMLMAMVEHLNEKLAKSTNSQQFHQDKVMEMEKELEYIKRKAARTHEEATHSDFMKKQMEMIKQRKSECMCQPTIPCNCCDTPEHSEPICTALEFDALKAKDMINGLVQRLQILDMQCIDCETTKVNGAWDDGRGAICRNPETICQPICQCCDVVECPKQTGSDFDSLRTADMFSNLVQRFRMMKARSKERRKTKINVPWYDGIC